MSESTLVVWDEILTSYDHGPGHPLLHQPGFIGPGIAERLVDWVLGQQVKADRMLVCGARHAVHAGPTPWG